MTIARMTAGDEDSIDTVLKTGDDKEGVYPPRTGNPNDPNIGRILDSTNPSQVSPGIAAPVTEKGNYLWLPMIALRSH